MIAKYRISNNMLFGALALLSIGEYATGTSVVFVAAMAATLLSIGITYNLLGGLGTFSGILFTAFSLRTIVISQVAKVLLFEASDINLEAPQLTIEVYMVFFFCLMVGIYTFWHIRLPFPRPLEATTEGQYGLMYAVSLSVGLAATLTPLIYGDRGGQLLRSFWLGFSSLLLFALVLAVDSRIRNTDGAHSFGLKALIPTAVLVLLAFMGSVRGPLLVPAIAYFATCYTRGYHFRRAHYIFGVVFALFFVLVLSPIEIYSRDKVDATTSAGRLTAPFEILVTLPDWKTVTGATDNASEAAGGRDIYFNRSGTFILNRLSLIRPDSSMISACSTGFHYGWAAAKNDSLEAIPKYLYKDKPSRDSAGLTGRVTGKESDEIENGEGAMSVIGDAFGGFGWWGVILFPVLMFPAMFIILESMFDISLPWGTVALGIFITLFGETSVGGYVGKIIRTPLEILMLSYLVGGLIRMIPNRGDR